jgi:pimeloyl-ACP methyl ester carboxylesterase
MWMTSTLAHQTFASFDGTRIAWRTMGAGRPVLMLHGFTADAMSNFIAPGIAARIMEAGFLCILPDLRGHGASDAPLDPARWPPDTLAMDQEALLAHLKIEDHDLLGYSLGARTAVRMLARGARPRRVVLGGMGGSGITRVDLRRAYFEDLLNGPERSSNPKASAYVMKTLAERGHDPAAMRLVLSQQVSTPPETLKTLGVPALAVSGAEDEDNGSAEELAALMPHAQAVRVPGNHLTAVAEPALAEAIMDFLGS